MPFYASLIRGGSRFELPMSSVLLEARATFCRQGPAQHNLCISHRKWHQLNKEANDRERLAHRSSSRVSRACGSGLVSFCSGARGGGRLATVSLTRWRASGRTLWLLGGVKLSFAHLASTMRLPWAQTYAYCQGTEFEGTLAIHDTDNKHVTMRHLFVALSRAKRKADVSVM